MKAAGPPMKMTRTGIANALATATEFKKAECAKMLQSLADLGTQQVKAIGKFTIPGLCTLKSRTKAAVKAGKRSIGGKMMLVRAKPARKVVRATIVSALKKAI